MWIINQIWAASVFQLVGNGRNGHDKSTAGYCCCFCGSFHARCAFDMHVTKHCVQGICRSSALHLRWIINQTWAAGCLRLATMLKSKGFSKGRNGLDKRTDGGSGKGSRRKSNSRSSRSRLLDDHVHTANTDHHVTFTCVHRLRLWLWPRLSLRLRP